MDLKFSFGASKPLPLASEGAASAAAPVSMSSTLELRVSLETGLPAVVVCEGLSGDGVSYGRAEKAVQDPASPAEVAAAARSVLARAGAELPEPLLGSVTRVVLALDGAPAVDGLGATVLAELGLAGGTPAIDDALQARTGITAGTPIHLE